MSGRTDKWKIEMNDEDSPPEVVFTFYDTLVPEGDEERGAWLELYAACTKDRVYLH